MTLWNWLCKRIIFGYLVSGGQILTANYISEYGYKDVWTRQEDAWRDNMPQALQLINLGLEL